MTEPFRVNVRARLDLHPAIQSLAEKMAIMPVDAALEQHIGVMYTHLYCNTPSSALLAPDVIEAIPRDRQVNVPAPTRDSLQASVIRRIASLSRSAPGMDGDLILRQVLEEVFSDGGIGPGGSALESDGRAQAAPSEAADGAEVSVDDGADGIDLGEFSPEAAHFDPEEVEWAPPAAGPDDIELVADPAEDGRLGASSTLTSPALAPPPSAAGTFQPQGVAYATPPLGLVVTRAGQPPATAEATGRAATASPERPIAQATGGPVGQPMVRDAGGGPAPSGPVGLALAERPARQQSDRVAVFGASPPVTPDPRAPNTAAPTSSILTLGLAEGSPPMQSPPSTQASAPRLENDGAVKLRPRSRWKLAGRWAIGVLAVALFAVFALGTWQEYGHLLADAPQSAPAPVATQQSARPLPPARPVAASPGPLPAAAAPAAPVPASPPQAAMLQQPPAPAATAGTGAGGLFPSAVAAPAPTAEVAALAEQLQELRRDFARQTAQSRSQISALEAERDRLQRALTEAQARPATPAPPAAPAQAGGQTRAGSSAGTVLLEEVPTRRPAAPQLPPSAPPSPAGSAPAPSPPRAAEPRVSGPQAGQPAVVAGQAPPAPARAPAREPRAEPRQTAPAQGEAKRPETCQRVVTIQSGVTLGDVAVRAQADLNALYNCNPHLLGSPPNVALSGGRLLAP